MEYQYLKCDLWQIADSLGTVAFAQDVVIHKIDGTTEVIENADSVVYDVKDYGYYGWIDANTMVGRFFLSLRLICNTFRSYGV